MNTVKGSKRILSVTVKRIADYDADTHLGEYSDTPNDYAIVQENYGSHAGEFVKDLPCECGHSESEHGPEGECLECRGNDDGCDYFDRVEIQRGREYRYFNPPIENYLGTPDDEMRKYCLQDYERMRNYNRGEWGFVGVRADAIVQLNGDLCQTVTSGGLWGIESDSGDYFKEVETEQLAELRDQLEAIGFTKRAVAAAFRNVQHKDE